MQNGRAVGGREVWFTPEHAGETLPAKPAPIPLVPFRSRVPGTLAVLSLSTETRANLSWRRNGGWVWGLEMLTNLLLS